MVDPGYRAELLSGGEFLICNVRQDRRKSVCQAVPDEAQGAASPTSSIQAHPDLKNSTDVEETGINPEEALAKLGDADTEDRVRSQAAKFGFDSVSSDELAQIPPDVIELVTESMAREGVFIPVRHDGNVVYVAIHDPNEFDVLDKLTFVLNREVRPLLASEQQIREAIDHHYGQGSMESVESILVEFDEAAIASSDNESPENTSQTQPDLRVANPVLLEIFNNLFASIAEQMGVTLQQTSCSTNVKERLDFSCAIFSPKGELVVNAPHIPVHLGAMGETVKRIIADNPTMSPGDVFVTNDPYRGGSHLPDVTVITPVHHGASGKLQFFTASRAHHAEIGGIVPGSMPPFSKNLGEEGVLIRNFKLVDKDESRETELRELLTSGTYPTRSVEDNISDVTAQVAANNLGVKLLNDLIDRYSLEVVQAYMSHIQSAAATKMRMALSRRPDGDYRFTDHLDDGSPISVNVRITGEQAVVDFTGTGPVLSTNLNANRAITTAAVLYVFRCLIDEDIPLNAGVLEPVEIIIPECLLNPPEQEDPSQSAAVVGGNVETSQRVVDTLLGALGLAAASQGTMNNLTFGDESFGYYETICGGSGATSFQAGADAVHTHMTNTRLTDVEIIERRYPVRVDEFSIRTGSGGEGEHRRGDGIVRKLRFLRPLKVSMLSERRGDFRPFGLGNGGEGTTGRNQLLREGEPPHNLSGKFGIEVRPNDVLVIESPGGGGYSP